MIRLALLGNVDLTGDGGAVLDAPLRRSKRIALLAYLATARPRGFHRRDKIVALFWPELPADRARAALRTTLSRLRDDCRIPSLGAPSSAAELILGRGVDEIAVNPAVVGCDVVEFDAALDAGRLDDAVALYRGPFLDGFHVEAAGEELESWIAGERARLRDRLLGALGALSGDAKRRGDLAGAVAFARQALDVSPADEVLARDLIGLLVASGNRGAAMRAYSDLVQRLQSEFGVVPAAETLALVESLRATGRHPSSSEASSSQTAAGPAVLSELAVGRLLESDNSAPPGRRPGAVDSSRRRPWQLVGAVAAVAAFVGAAWMMTHASSPRAASPAPVAEWRAIRPINDTPRAHAGSRAVLDSTGNALLVFGGVVDDAGKVLVPLGDGYWRLRGLAAGDAASWTHIMPAPGPHPASRWLFGASSDAAHDRVIMHGGALGFTSPCANDTWVLNHASAIGHMSAWRSVAVRGRTAPGRADFDQVFDARRRRLIVFAGHDCIYPRFSDTWVLSFDDSTLATGAWSVLAPDSSAGVPVQRDVYTAAYDTTAGRLFIFGGRASTVPTGEIWALDHAAGTDGAPAWHPVHCAGSAPAIVGPASTMDFASDTWTFFGGSDAADQARRSVWRIHGVLRDIAHCRWEELPPAEPSPAARYGATAAPLAGSRGMLVFGGAFANTALADAWVLVIHDPSRDSTHDSIHGGGH